MEKEKLYNELEKRSYDKEGMLPICSFSDCARMRIECEGEEDWFSREENPALYDRVFENYHNEHDSESRLSHGLCPACVEKHYGLTEEELKE